MVLEHSKTTLKTTPSKTPLKPLLDNLDGLEQAVYSKTFFFLRLPSGQYGPVSQLSQSEKSCTGPFNWGEAHCAGEKVKRRTGPFQRKSLRNQTRTTTQQRGAVRHGNQEPPGQAPRCTGRKNQPPQTRGFIDRSWYALTYKEMP